MFPLNSQCHVSLTLITVYVKFLSAFSSHHSVCLIFHAALISLLSYTLLLLPQYFFSLSLIVNYRHDDFLQTFFRSIFKVINCLLTKSHSGDGSTTISGPTSFGVCGEPASCPSSGITEKRPRWRYGDPPGYYKNNIVTWGGFKRVY